MYFRVFVTIIYLNFLICIVIILHNIAALHYSFITTFTHLTSYNINEKFIYDVHVF